jgi:hypothetical protein
MTLKIIDESNEKKKNKVRDESFKKFCDENKNNKDIEKVNVVRNSKGEIVLWEIHTKEIKKSKKEVSK